MNTRILYILTLAFYLISPNLQAQKQISKDDVIFKAMADEMARSSSSLKLDKYAPPFYIAYQVNDYSGISIRASLGSLINAQDFKNKSNTGRLMVGDYSLNDENFVSGSQSYQSGGTFLPFPLETDYSAMRKCFWAMSDRVYKSAVDKYEQKLTALKQQNKEESEKIDDYSKISPVTKIMEDIQIKIEQAKWEGIVKDLSSIFRNYGQIATSNVSLTAYNSTIYYITNEGTKLKYPLSILMLNANASTQAEDGETIKDQLNYYVLSADQLPSIDKLKAELTAMAEKIVAKCKAPIIEDSYTGPVIFEGEGLAELINQRLFSSGGLIASREPVYAVERRSQGSVNKFDNRINQKVFSDIVNIKATPKVKTFNSTPLIGSFEIDAEGVVPADELVLVEKGILKTLLNDRTPTPKIPGSNGHMRTGLGGSGAKGPGVINVTIENGITLDSLRKKALADAAANGLEFIYVVRNLENALTMGLPKPSAIYKVSTKTGEEKLIRSVVISDFPVTTLKQITAGTKEQFVFNTLRSNSLVSYILPKAIIINDLSLEKDKSTKPKPPVVPSPIMALK